MQQQQLTMFRGNTRMFDFSITLGGNPVDLTDARLRFTAKTSPGANAVVFQKSVGSGIWVAGAADGFGFIMLFPSDTLGLPLRRTQLYIDLSLI